MEATEKKIPEGLVRLPENISNLDNSIPEGTETVLKKGKALCFHAAWNYAGYIWYEEGKFFEEVWQYNNHVDTLSGDSLDDLLEKTRNQYGTE